MIIIFSTGYTNIRIFFEMCVCVCVCVCVWGGGGGGGGGGVKVYFYLTSCITPEMS